MPRLRRSSFAVLVLAFATVVLAACGSSDGGGSGSFKDDAAKVLQQTFSGAKSIKSGQLGVTLAAKEKGQQPNSISISGPFASRGPSKVPSFDLTLAVSAKTRSFAVGATSTGMAGYVTVAGTSYAIDPKMFRELAEGYTSSQSSSSSSSTQLNELTPSKLGIDPRRWLTSPKIVGTVPTGGTETIHVVTGISVPQLLTDLDVFLTKASRTVLRGTGRPMRRPLTAAQLAKMRKAITGAKVDVFTGKDDKILRRMVVTLDVTPPGDSRGTVTMDVRISDLNQPQTITAPKDPQPFSTLQKQLDGVMAALEDGDATSSGSSSDAAAFPPEYLICVQKAGGDLSKAQQCDSAVGQ